MRDETGSVSLLTLFLIVAVSILAASVSQGIIGIGPVVHTLEDRLAEKDDMRSRAFSVLALLRSEEHVCDSPVDTIWEAVDALAEDGYVYELDDISSRLNLNWLDSGLLSDPAFEAIFGPVQAEEFAGVRQEKGFTMDMAGTYGDLFDESALNNFFTVHSFANVYSCDAWAFAGIYAIRTGNEGSGPSFAEQIQDAIAAGSLQNGDEAIPELDTVSPVITTEPQLNVHFIPEELLTAFLQSERFGVENPADAGEAILALRATFPLNLDDLRDTITVREDPESDIFVFFGVTTTFWRIRVTGPEHIFTWIIASLPGEDELEREYMIVEEEYCSR